jgi:hypothetical protein
MGFQYFRRYLYEHVDKWQYHDQPHVSYGNTKQYLLGRRVDLHSSNNSRGESLAVKACHIHNSACATTSAAEAPPYMLEKDMSHLLMKELGDTVDALTSGGYAPA